MGLPEHMLVECKLSWQGKTESYVVIGYVIVGKCLEMMYLDP